MFSVISAPSHTKESTSRVTARSSKQLICELLPEQLAPEEDRRASTCRLVVKLGGSLERVTTSKSTKGLVKRGSSGTTRARYRSACARGGRGGVWFRKRVVRGLQSAPGQDPPAPPPLRRPPPSSLASSPAVDWGGATSPCSDPNASLPSMGKVAMPDLSPPFHGLHPFPGCQ